MLDDPFPGHTPLDESSPEPTESAAPRQDHWSRLAVRASDGDAAAFEQLIGDLDPRFARYFRLNLTKVGRLDRTDVDELSQRAAVELWKALATRGYQPERASILTLAYAIARNVWLRFLRDGRRAGRYRRATLPEHEPAIHDDPGELLGEAEILARLARCVEALRRSGGLSTLDQAILSGLLRGESEREIAAAAGAASSTVHDRKKILMNKLRVCIKGEEISRASDGAP